MPYAVDSKLNAVIKCPRKITEAPGADEKSRYYYCYYFWEICKLFGIVIKIWDFTLWRFNTKWRDRRIKY